MPRLMVLIVVLVAAGCLRPGRAVAHAILMDSQPAAQATMPPGPASVRLRFNSRIDQARSRLVLRTGRNETALQLDSASSADTLAASTILAPGSYVMRWQVLAVDGHITRGDVPFTVRAP